MKEGRLRLAIAVAVLAVAGCGAPTDPTPNRMAVGTGDYPPPPYGYAGGTTIADLQFVGKQSPAPADYQELPMQALSLATLRQDTQLIVLEGAARWCVPCNQDQPAFKSLAATYGPRGVTTVEVLVEGTYGVAAKEEDISRWASAHQLSGIIAIDPDYELSKYADVTAFPVYLVIRAATMKIEHMQVSSLAAQPLAPVLDGLLAP